MRLSVNDTSYLNHADMANYRDLTFICDLYHGIANPDSLTLCKMSPKQSVPEEDPRDA